MATSEEAKPHPMVKPEIPRVMMGRGGYLSNEERIKKDEEELEDAESLEDDATELVELEEQSEAGLERRRKRGGGRSRGGRSRGGRSSSRRSSRGRSSRGTLTKAVMTSTWTMTSTDLVYQIILNVSVFFGIIRQCRYES